MPASASSLSGLLPTSPAAPGSLSAVESIRLVQALRTVPDPRRRRGRRHGLQSVLLLALQAVMAGASSWVAIAQWSATAPQGLSICGAPPSASTFRRVLAVVDVTALEAALTRWANGSQNLQNEAKAVSHFVYCTTQRGLVKVCFPSINNSEAARLAVLESS